MLSQKYEDYWKLTLEYTDYNGVKFLGTLKIIVDFLDNNSSLPYSSSKFVKLQEEVNAIYPKKDMGSIRKSINQFVKLGFIKHKLQGYNSHTKDFLNAKTNRRRSTISSQIIYESSNFNGSITNISNRKEINFVVKTLEEVGKLTKHEIMGLMTVDIQEIGKGYFTSEELEESTEKAKEDGFLERKYNQVSYLWGLLNKLDDLCVVGDELFFEEDAQVDIKSRKSQYGNVRDSYLHRLYKNNLKEESNIHFKEVKCMLEKLSYPSLVASHIKPFIKSDDFEAYDPNNGILLSRNMDILFDKGYITFNDAGKVIISSRITEEVSNYLSVYFLDKEILNQERKDYMEYHRKHVFK